MRVSDDGLTRLAKISLKQARRLVVLVIGGSILLIGLAMVVLPGPAVVVVPVGLGVLGTEFVWARWLVKKIKRRVAEGVSQARKMMGSSGKTRNGGS